MCIAACHTVPTTQQGKFYCPHWVDVETEVQKSNFNNYSGAEELINKHISAAVAKAVEPLYQSRGIPTNLNNEHVQKNTDVFDGLFV